MRLFFAFIILSCSFNINAQIIDFEVINSCLIDSTSLKGEVKFKRVRVLNTGEIKDYLFDLTGEYTTTGLIKSCDDLELLDAECYEVVGGEYCDYSLFFPASSSSGLTRQIDSIFSNDIYLTLNYPYILQNSGSSDFAEYTRLHADLAAYMDNYGYFYTSIGPSVNIRGTNLELTHSVQRSITSTGSSLNNFGQSSVINCVSVKEQDIKLYRNQVGEISLIIDAEGIVFDALPTTRIRRVECDLELLDKECYQVIDTLDPVCDYSLNVPFVASSPFDPFVRQLIDSVYFEGTFMALQNYPYEVQGSNQTAGIAQLSDDIRNYYITNNIDFAYISDLNVYGTRGALTRNAGRIILSSGAENDISYTLTPTNCQGFYSSRFYSLYRNVSGGIQTIVAPDGRIIQSLPDDALKIECCLVCEEIAGNACQVRNKTRTVLLTNASQTFYANSFYSISAWHISGSLRYQVGGSQPIDFINHSNFTMSDTSNDPCTYKDAQYLFDTSILGNSGAGQAGQVLIQIHY